MLLHPKHVKIVQEILSRHVPHTRVVVFGSRVKGTKKEYADLDLCIMTKQPLALETLANLREDFSESDLPMRVDIVDWATTDPEFKKIIEANAEDIFPY